MTIAAEVKVSLLEKRCNHVNKRNSNVNIFVFVFASTPYEDIYTANIVYDTSRIIVRASLKSR